MEQQLCCRSCGSNNLKQVIDLGIQPLANNLLNLEDIGRTEPMFPLEVWVCRDCWLLQISHIVPPVTLFSEYVYFSSFSDHMLRHAREASLRYIQEKKLNGTSFVVEIASNDGYLLKNFVEVGVPCLGFEPARNIAEAARNVGVETHEEFFGEDTALSLKTQRGTADLILGNNVFAHAPEINDFVAGLQALLKPDGWVVLEFPYALDMLDKVEFDTIYHEHVFYFALTPLLALFARHGLDIFHVERIPIHGGSLRLFATQRGAEPIRDSVPTLHQEELERGIATDIFYQRFCQHAAKVKANLIDFLQAQKESGKRVAAYGAAAKGNTLLNYVGDAARSVEFISDRSHYKHGKYSPGIHIPIVDAGALTERAPDYTLLLAWNFADEIMSQQNAYANAGGRFVIPLPELHII